MARDISFVPGTCGNTINGVMVRECQDGRYRPVPKTLKGYREVPNKDAFKFMDGLVAKQGITFVAGRKIVRKERMAWLGRCSAVRA